eukprot:UN23846
MFNHRLLYLNAAGKNKLLNRIFIFIKEFIMTTKAKAPTATDLVINAIADSLQITKKEAVTVRNAVTEAFVSVTAETGRLPVSDLGIFKVSDRAARKGRNPQTGESIDIAAHKVVSFKPAESFKAKVN